MSQAKQFAKPFRVTNGRKFRLKDIDPADTGELTSKLEADGLLEQGVAHLSRLQEKLLRPASLGTVADFSGHGCRGQRWNDQTRDVGSQPSGMPGLLIQSAVI